MKPEKKPIILNQDQQNLISSLTKFVNTKTKKDIDNVYVLSGQAGVGKTTSIRFFLNSISDMGLRVAVTTPTNKSLKVIKEAIGSEVKGDISFMTVYSLLGLRLEPSGAVKELVGRDDKNDAGSYDIVLIDEASMLKKLVITHLERKTLFTGTKIILLGDKEQLPPVGEVISAIWDAYGTSFELTKVERHDNAILSFVQNIRANPRPKIESTGDGVNIVNDDSFSDKIEEMAQKGLFHIGTAKSIAWRNVTVDTLNQFIRESFEMTNSKLPYVKGDRLVMTAPVQSDFENAPSLANTDDEALVLSASVDRHPKYPQFKIWAIDARLETGDTIVLRVIHEDSIDEFNAFVDGFAKENRWNLFWKCKDSFHSVKYAYAITSHRSQGSSFKYVFVDVPDIMMNRDVDTRTKCLYVACSRASEELFLLKD